MNPSDASSQSGMTWLAFAILTVVSWGVYGVFLHNGQMQMQDPVFGRYKAFLFVGLAYFLTAVLAPLLLLWTSGADWKYPAGGMIWSLVAGIVGAIGAFGVLLAFGSGGRPAVVMAIVFSGAPLVNAIVSMISHPPAGGLGAVRPGFWLGMVFAAVGGCLVSIFKPLPGKPAPKPVAAEVQPVQTPPAGQP